MTNSWTWSTDEDPGIGGTEFSIELKDGQIFWKYTEDRWGRGGEQTFADFVEFGPLWSDAPADVLAELVARLGVSGRPWQVPGYKDYSPVWWAVDRFREQEALTLLTSSDALRRYHGQQTLLILAAEKSMLPVVRRLLEMGADASARDENGRTALMMACAQLPPPMEIFRALLDHGADINAANADGKTALITFCSSMNPSVEGLELLLSRGADRGARDKGGKSALDWLAARPYLAKELSDLVRH